MSKEYLNQMSKNYSDYEPHNVFTDEENMSSVILGKSGMGARNKTVTI
jgi:hypothetical protein